MRPESVTWVPSPAAYSSRNAVSLAFAAVFLTAANALGSSNAMRASFIVDLRDDAIATARGNLPAADLAKLGSFARKHLQQSCVAARGVRPASAACNR